MSPVLLYNLVLILVTHQTLHVSYTTLSFIARFNFSELDTCQQNHVLRLSNVSRQHDSAFIKSHLGVVWLSLTGN